MSRAKSPETRQRRNVSETAATLIDDGGEPEQPKLPAGIKQKETRTWWKVIWASPMAKEWLAADHQALLRLAILVDKFWALVLSPLAPVKEVQLLLGEIAKQEARFGLTPYDRHRMQWKVEKPTEKAELPVADPGVDPRTVLRAVK